MLCGAKLKTEQAKSALFTTEYNDTSVLYGINASCGVRFCCIYKGGNSI